MHQNPPFSGKNSNFFLGPRLLPLDRLPPHYEILDPPLGGTVLTVKVSVVDSPGDGWSWNSLCDTLQYNASIGCHFQVTWHLREVRRYCVNTYIIIIIIITIQ